MQGSASEAFLLVPIFLQLWWIDGEKSIQPLVTYPTMIARAPLSGCKLCLQADQMMR
ncbi:hypothetical protein KC19_7G145900 [Ceratodon purpureus]|uniref:Uncharacterized protein n=1 Tax=Ceratodon purpureus TaxID=3225 RepID=A0A8T0H6K2_CERPU|nr:hypothetical protein KC19_7G145900 [Ceratodon purpureus]